MSSAPPGWYPDTQNPAFRRYWDGLQWVGDPVPAPAEDATGRAAPGKGQAAKVPMFGTRAYAKRQSQELAEAHAENQRLRAQLASLGGLEITELQRKRDEIAAQLTSEQALLHSLQEQVIHTREELVLQEIGIYEYHHPLSDVVAYRSQLDQLQAEIKYAARRDGGAIEAAQNWEVNGSITQGRRMISEYSKLMLRAYNAEADNLVRSLKPYKLRTALDRLEKTAVTIERLGRTMQVRVNPWYHQLRRRELELTADYLEKVARQKEAERAERDRLREDRRAQQELEREQQRLEKQHEQARTALTALEVAGSADTAKAHDLQEKLADLESALTAIRDRASNLRAGYVYVISNVGAFGKNMVQIGMTRRVDPYERISDLNNSSVPFKYDLHTMFFDMDAAGIEEKLHERLADKRVNQVNLRREFFYATPAEVRAHLQELTGELLEFTELAEAEDYRRSRAAADGASPDPNSAPQKE
ncbi:DUF4041 domain-containing protein [Nocardia africana]